MEFTNVQIQIYSANVYEHHATKDEIKIIIARSPNRSPEGM